MVYSFKQSKQIQVVSSILVVTIAAILIAFIHQYFHFLFSIDDHGYYPKGLIKSNYYHTSCINNFEKPISVIAGPLSLFFISIIAIILLNYFPKNLFFASIGLIASSARLGAGFALLLNSFISRYQVSIINDEWLILNMLNLKDMAIGNAFLFFYLMAFSVLFVLSIRLYEVENKIKWVVVISAILLQILVNFYIENYIVEFLLI